MTSTANRSTPNYILRPSGATGKPECVCIHCGGSIARTSNPREVTWFHLDRVDEGCTGYECSRDSETVAEPAETVKAAGTAKRWEVRIAEARMRGYFSIADIDLSADWVTCACGEQSPGIPRFKKDGRIGLRNRIYYEGEPIDQKLANLGRIFTEHINVHDFDSAEATLALIEQRAAIVLAETSK